MLFIFLVSFLVLIFFRFCRFAVLPFCRFAVLASRSFYYVSRLPLRRFLPTRRCGSSAFRSAGRAEVSSFRPVSAPRGREALSGSLRPSSAARTLADRGFGHFSAASLRRWGRAAAAPVPTNAARGIWVTTTYKKKNTQKPINRKSSRIWVRFLQVIHA